MNANKRFPFLQYYNLMEIWQSEADLSRICGNIHLSFKVLSIYNKRQIMEQYFALDGWVVTRRTLELLVFYKKTSTIGVFIKFRGLLPKPFGNFHVFSQKWPFCLPPLLKSSFPNSFGRWDSNITYKIWLPKRRNKIKLEEYSDNYPANSNNFFIDLHCIFDFIEYSNEFESIN